MSFNTNPTSTDPDPAPGGYMAPPGVSIDANMAEAKSYADHSSPNSAFESYKWFYEKVKNNKDGSVPDSWDYKQGRPEFEPFGNFSYGAVGTAMGIPAWLLLAVAGAANLYAEPSRVFIFGLPFLSPSNGDDPADQQAIRDGIDYAKNNGYDCEEPLFPQGDPFTGLPWPGSPDLDSWTTDFGGAESTTSPLVLDLNGDGVQTTRLSNSFTQGVHFNLDATGLAENTAWVDAQDGLLVRDLNGDGQISSGRELFGNHTLLHNGARAANGFEALKELDNNADGVVDANDALFASLKVWKDANSDGVTDTGELLTLAQAGVKSFNVSYTSSDSADANGNQHLQQGSFTTTDDSTQSMNDVWFKVDTARTQDTDMLSVSDEIAALPDAADKDKHWRHAA